MLLLWLTCVHVPVLFFALLMSLQIIIITQAQQLKPSVSATFLESAETRGWFGGHMPEKYDLSAADRVVFVVHHGVMCAWPTCEVVARDLCLVGNMCSPRALPHPHRAAMAAPEEEEGAIFTTPLVMDIFSPTFHVCLTLEQYSSLMNVISNNFAEPPSVVPFEAYPTCETCHGLHSKIEPCNMENMYIPIQIESGSILLGGCAEPIAELNLKSLRVLYRAVNSGGACVTALAKEFYLYDDRFDETVAPNDEHEADALESGGGGGRKVPVHGVVAQKVCGSTMFGIPVLSCLVLSCLVLSCLVLSCLVLSCLVLSCLVLSCLVVSLI
jgi:hypothetical protein